MLYSEFLKKNHFLKNSNDCPFCRPALNRVFKSNRYAYLTYALAPYHKHHLLVIPKRHVESLLKLKIAEERAIMALLDYATRLVHANGYEDCSLLVRDGGHINRSISHLHYHVIPNVHIGDLDHAGKKRRIMTPEEIHKVSKDIKKAEKKIIK